MLTLMLSTAASSLRAGIAFSGIVSINAGSPPESPNSANAPEATLWTSGFAFVPIGAAFEAVAASEFSSAVEAVFGAALAPGFAFTFCSLFCLSLVPLVPLVPKLHGLDNYLSECHGRRSSAFFPMCHGCLSMQHV